MPGNRPLRALVLLALAIGAGSAAAAPAPAVATIPPLSASADADRTFADIPLSASVASPAALAVSFADPVPAAVVRAVTLHLRCGAGWRTATLPAERARGRVRIPFGAFSSVEGDPGPAARADLARVSLWRRAPGADTPPVGVESAGLVPPAAVAVARTDAAFAARCERLLGRLGVPFDLVPPDFSREALDGVRLLFLPEASALSGADAARLRDFVRRGGRLAVFYASHPVLADAVGVVPGAWETAPGGWTAFALRPSGRRVPHRTENLLCPAPGPRARTLATWIDAAGGDTGKPAVVLAPGGAWFAHVPPRAYPAACALLADVLAALVPDLAPVPPKPAAGPPLAVPEGFLLAAWADAPPPKPLPAAAAPLRALFVRPAAGRTLRAPADAPPAVHAWLPCLCNDSGAWRDPADPAVRAAVADEAVRLVRAGAEGIHLDYVRTPAGAPASPERAAAVTALVRAVSRAVRAERSGAAVSAAVFPTPGTAAAVNQDWPAWIREGLVDFVAPMIYEDDPEAFRASLAQCLAAAPPDRLVAGIGTGADESQADAAAVRAEVAAAVGAHLRGVAFFAFDDALLELLPGLVAAPAP